MKNRCSGHSQLSAQQISLARHALGLSSRTSNSYRNRFVTGAGSVDYQPWLDMVETGHAIRIDGAKLPFGGNDLFCLTPAGAKLALEPGDQLDSEDFPPEVLT